MKKLSIILFLLLFNSCVTNYYYVNIEEDTTIYSSKNGTESIILVPKGSSVYITKSDKTYRKIKWKNYKGWVLNPVYNSSINTSNNISSTAGNSNYTSSPSKSHTTSSKAYSGGTVYVKGYTRKNGTYVKPHTRSAPKRR